MDMCYPFFSTLSASAHLDAIKTLENGNPYYKNDNYYNKYEIYSEPEIKTTSNVYHDLVSSPKYRHEDWKFKVIKDWADNDTVSWLIEYTISQGLYGGDIPYYNFKVSGIELRNMRREEVIQRMTHPNVDQNLSIKMADKIFDTLQDRFYEEIHRKPSALRYTLNDPYTNNDVLHSVLDLDDHRHRTALDYKTNDISLLRALDSRNESEDGIHSSLPSSMSCYSNNSKFRDRENKTKLTKKPSRRPKGSGENKIKRLRNVSIPEFLCNLLMDEKYRDIIVWEDYSQLKFRFIKPDEVAKLWGQMKQNDNMTFEKFSRAMRYHYRQKVLVSVPTARLVYQFGSKGPDFKTQNPNFVKVKSEDLQDMSYS